METNLAFYLVPRACTPSTSQATNAMRSCTSLVISQGPGVALEGAVRPRHGPFVPAFLRVDFWHLEHLIPDFESFQSPVVIGPANVPTWSNFGHVWS